MKILWKRGLIAWMSVVATLAVLPVETASARPPEPPPIREQVPPCPYKKGIWVDGHWNWKPHKEVWKWESGYWIPKHAMSH